MPRRITPQTSLDNLKNEARRWLKALRAGDIRSRARFERVCPGAPASPTLRDVQHGLAREFDLPGWKDLKAAIESGASRAAPVADPREPIVARFLEYACPDHHVRGRPAHRVARHAAMRLLERHPEIARHDLYTAVVCGEAAEVARLLEERPELATARRPAAGPDRSGAGGDYDFLGDLGTKPWEPLLYLCFTRVPHPASSENAVEIARLLLDRGADPNAFFMAGDSRYTPLTGVVGEGEEDRPPHPRRDELARLLMEHGANPYDTQVVYNVHFHGRALWYLKLAYEFSVRAGRGADWDDPEWRMFDVGSYGTGAAWFLRMAVENDDEPMREWCIRHGARPDAAPARQAPQGEDAFVAVSLSGDRAEVERLLAGHPEYLRSPRAIFAAAERDRADVVEMLLDLGTPIEVEDEHQRRPLYVAAANDAVRVAGLLIDRGAEIDHVEREWHNTPIDAAVYFELPRMIDVLVPHTRDVGNLVFLGKLDRLREVLSADPSRAARRRSPLFNLPEDEAIAAEMVRLLLAHGADASQRNRQGLTAADVARRRGLVEAAVLLEHAGYGGVARAARRSVEDYERAADALAAAFGSADAGALERVRAHFGMPVTVEDVRAFVWRRVHDVRQRAGEGRESYLTRDEARELVAREAGFGGWPALVEAVSADRPAPGAAYQIDRQQNTISPRRALGPDEWDVLVGVMKEQRLTAFDANGQATDALVERIASLDHVTALRLGGSRALTDAGLALLARMPQLEELDISGAAITDRGLEVLRHLPNLRRVAMCWQRGITDAGVAHLASCERLETVDVMGTFTGDGLIAALAGKQHLRSLKTGRQVTDAGLGLLRGLPAFVERPSADPRNVYRLMDAAAGVTSLLLDGPFTNAGLAQLAALEGLFALDFFWHAKAITSDGLGALSLLPNLEWLGCGGELCDDRAMRHIGALPRLRMLQGQNTVAGDEGFEALARSQTLEYFWGRDCPNFTSRGFIALSRMPSLRGLGVSCKFVDDEALALLPDFPSLVELMPMDVPDAGFRHVGRCERLERLWMMYCRDTTDAATEQIADLSRMNTYYAGRTKITDRSLEILSAMESLERLTFWEVGDVTSDGVRLLARLPRLKELTLDGLPKVTPDVLTAFASHVRVSYAP